MEGNPLAPQGPARYPGIHQQTVYHRLNGGKISSYHMGRDVRIPAPDVLPSEDIHRVGRGRLKAHRQRIYLITSFSVLTA